uniref:Putative secreted protein n=1 Tax=Ixodes ricinus TaxID=34613 RepID=A0A6B0TU62_IXORI
MPVCFALTLWLDQLCFGKDVWFSLGEGSLQRQCNQLQVPLVFFFLPIGYSWSPPFSASISLSGLLRVWPRS